MKKGEILGEKYRVERTLGQGGMGIVVAARHLQLGQLVAIKFLLPHALLNTETVERFLREARALVQLRGENVARVFDVGTLDQNQKSTPYIVMEHLEGQDLSKVLTRGPIPIEDAVTYIIQAADGIQEAHRLGIIHRDLKPGNLFLTRRINGAPLIKVLDFGISKLPGDVRMTETTSSMGTPLYMSPEQMNCAKNAEVPSDIWSLGAVLYELLTGHTPFDGSSVTEICMQVLTKPPPPLSKYRRGVPTQLEDIVLRCLQKDPALRFQKASELGEALIPFAPIRTVSRESLPFESANPGLLDTAMAPAVSQAIELSRRKPTHRKTMVFGFVTGAMVLGLSVLAFKTRHHEEPATPVTASSSTPASVPTPTPTETIVVASPQPAVPSAAPSASASVIPRIKRQPLRPISDREMSRK